MALRLEGADIEVESEARGDWVMGAGSIGGEAYFGGDVGSREHVIG